MCSGTLRRVSHLSTVMMLGQRTKYHKTAAQLVLSPYLHLANAFVRSNSVVVLCLCALVLHLCSNNFWSFCCCFVSFGNFKSLCDGLCLFDVVLHVFRHFFCVFVVVCVSWWSLAVILYLCVHFMSSCRYFKRLCVCFASLCHSARLHWVERLSSDSSDSPLPVQQRRAEQPSLWIVLRVQPQSAGMEPPPEGRKEGRKERM